MSEVKQAASESEVEQEPLSSVAASQLARPSSSSEVVAGGQPGLSRRIGSVTHQLKELSQKRAFRRLMIFGVLGSSLVASGTWLKAHPPVAGIEPGEVGVRVNTLTGSVSEAKEGWLLVVPGLHKLRRYSLRDQIYRPENSASAEAATPFQSIEGLNIGADVTVRYALDPTRISGAAQTLPDDVNHGLIEPMVDAVLHQVFSKHTVREIFSSQRAEIQKEIEDGLKPILAADGVQLRAVFVGNVDLPADYKKGLESLLTEELTSEQMKYTLVLKEQQVKQAALEADAEKVKREKAAEAAGSEEIIAAKSKAEAMQHILPFKEKEIEQRRLESEANKVQRLSEAEANAEARRIEAAGEADSRKKLADSDAYRAEVLAKVNGEAMEHDAALVSKNPLLIQKALADKLSDKISVIIAPPQAGGFFAAGLLGQGLSPAQVTQARMGGSGATPSQPVAQVQTQTQTQTQTQQPGDSDPNSP